MKWFNNPKSLEELKRQYRDLTKRHHPDLGGSAEEMKEINNEYDQLFSRLKNVHESADGKTTYHSKTENTERPESFRAIIDELVKMRGITIEIIGSWIWVTGNTMPVKENLKVMGFHWAKAKKAWYYHEDGYRKKSHKKMSLDAIRDLYGSETITGSENGKSDRRFIA